MPIYVSKSFWISDETTLSTGRFMHAPNSRARLRATRKMLTTVATYHQIMPSFLDLLFSFGAQHHAKDFSFTAFRHDTRLSCFEKNAAIPSLGRSGRNIQLCYSLRSVEASPAQEMWPWSIRGTATHHSFDLETGRTTWLILKGEGGASIKDRVIAETSSLHANALNQFSDRGQAFSSAMLSHLLLNDWSVENWRWYVNYMEEEVQTLTRKTLSVTITKSQTRPKPLVLFTRTVTGALIPSKEASTSKSQTMKHQSTISLAKVPPALPSQGVPGSPGPPPSIIPSGLDEQFSFEDLRKIERIEEQANEALLVITLNNGVLSALTQHYASVMESSDCPQDLKETCTVSFRRFQQRISDVSAEIQTQKARMETLLRLLADRRGLV